jgi:small-conductance mechanosensitive channel
MSPEPEQPKPPAEAQDEAPAAEGRLERWRDIEHWQDIKPIELSRAAIHRARAETLVLVALFAGVVFVYDQRRPLLGIHSHQLHPCPRSGSCFSASTAGTTAQVITVLALVILGWAVARDLGRMLGPLLENRLDPATAGTVGFLVRLFTLLVAVVVALRIAGVDTADLAIGASFTAVVFGLAAQQTLGNLIAGTVLLSARPFRVGDRVRLQGGPLAGRIEGTAITLGLLYTTFATGEDHVLVPNSVVLGVSVTPLREPDAVSLRARLQPGSTPLALQRVLEEGLTVPLRGRPSITLEEFDWPEVIVQISATPVASADGGKLAGELLAVVSSQVRTSTQEHKTTSAQEPTT